MNDLVSIIVRTHSKDRMTKLSEAIKSLENNTYRPIEVIIVIQSEDEQYIEEINKIAKHKTTLDFRVFTLVNKTSLDERAKNLNIGIKSSKGRYLGFLDDDDLIYQDHLSKIVSELNTSEHSWAYCGYNLVLYDSDSCQILKSEEIFIPFTIERLLNDNFIPMHSFLIDKQRIHCSLRFDEGLSVFEDYNFILRLSFHDFPQFIPHTTSEYRLWSDGTNTHYTAEIILGQKFLKKGNEWIRSISKIEALKKDLYPTYKSRSIKKKLKLLLYSRFPLISQLRNMLNNIIAVFFKKTI